MRQARNTRAEHRAQDERRGKYSHTFCQCAHDEKKRGGEVLSLNSEPPLQQLIRRQQLALKISRDEKQADNDSRDDVAQHDLQVSQAAALLGPRESRISECWHSDQR